MSKPTACEVCLRLTTGQVACPRHPYATLLRLDRSADRDWFAIVRSQRRQSRLRAVALGLVSLQVLIFVLTGSFFFLMTLVLPLTLVAYIGLESVLERVGAARSAAVDVNEDTELQPHPEIQFDDGEQSAMLRAERRNRRTARNNTRRRQVKASQIRGGG